MLMVVGGMWDRLYLSEGSRMDETIDLYVGMGIEKRISPALLVVTGGRGEEEEV